MAIAIIDTTAELTRLAVESCIANASAQHASASLIAIVQARLKIARLTRPTTKASASTVATTAMATAIFNA